MCTKTFLSLAKASAAFQLFTSLVGEHIIFFVMLSRHILTLGKVPCCNFEEKNIVIVSASFYYMPNINLNNKNKLNSKVLSPQAEFIVFQENRTCIVRNHCAGTHVPVMHEPFQYTR